MTFLLLDFPLENYMRSLLHSTQEQYEESKLFSLQDSQYNTTDEHASMLL